MRTSRSWLPGGTEEVVGRTISLSTPPGRGSATGSGRTAPTRSRSQEAELAGPLGLPDGVHVPPERAALHEGRAARLARRREAVALPKENRDTLEALTSQVALALDSAALTEDLLRQQTEARFRSLVQNSTDVVMVVDADSTVRYVSPSVHGVFGYDPGELEGTKLTGLIHPDDKTQVLQFLTATSREGGVRPRRSSSRGCGIETTSGSTSRRSAPT